MALGKQQLAARLDIGIIADVREEMAGWLAGWLADRLTGRLTD
jgi:hypothetical protein